ncbi:murein biosynthesis integral membrane protein MurJ [Chitiniphilus purpureus]|uniref:Probable lipid II flippase MurJ n=1 Tax=Chitiniphilus purpureus TaxID=2981137 RepID=A0ABY6DR14_9NEIS|nr:murein biosynthesis integral membrane protein MurJ [Chitiniphilus sp. CD1]UXY16668.1 murein biosynthesis integral membrane protein MurJ [Chitiniphilus sp. CD1]
MNLLKSLAKVSSMTLVSRVLGFVRDALTAQLFGTSIATDAFFVAQKLPNMLRRIFAEGAFSQAFVPILAEYKNRHGEAAAREFFAHVAGTLTLVLAVVTALGIIAAPAVVWISAFGFTNKPAQFDLTVQMLRITFPYILLISLSSLLGAVLNTWNRFSVPAFVPTLLNVAMIGSALLLAPFCDPPEMALAWGMLLGGVLQLTWQFPALKRIGMLVRPRLDWRNTGVWRVIKQMGPAILGVSVSQISLLINTTFASLLAAGSISWMYYADRLMEFPTGLLGVALGTILLPSLAKSHAGNDSAEYSRLLDWGLRLSLLLALPSAVAMAAISGPLVSTLFQRGEFDAHDALMTQQALIAYTVGLVGLILVKILAPGFYARQNIKTPVKIALITLTATQLMNLAFIWHLRHAGLALSIGLAACLNAALLYRQLRRHGIFTPQPGWGVFFGKLVLAVLAMAAALVAMMWLLPDFAGVPLLQRVAQLTALVAAGLFTYFGVLALLGFRPRDFSRRAVT